MKWPVTTLELEYLLPDLFSRALSEEGIIHRVHQTEKPEIIPSSPRGEFFCFGQNEVVDTKSVVQTFDMLCRRAAKGIRDDIGSDGKFVVTPCLVFDPGYDPGFKVILGRIDKSISIHFSGAVFFGAPPHDSISPIFSGSKSLPPALQ